MFRRLSEPLPLSAASLLLLRPALNAPVLNVGWLPVGPARAALVAFAEEYGGIGIALGLRSNESGQLAVVRNQESIDFDVPIPDALEPLLAEAERMGFLFDEDVLESQPGDAGRTRALTTWAELMGGLESLLVPELGELVPAERRGGEEEGASGPLSPSLAVEEAQYPELILDDVAPFELEDEDRSVGAESPRVDATATLEPDVPPPLEGASDAGAQPFAELDADPDEDLELEDDFDGALEDALGDPLEDPLEDAWAIDDPLFGEADLTEPTAPVGAVRHSERAPAPMSPAPAAPAAPAAVAPSAPRTSPSPSPASAPRTPPPVAVRPTLSKFRQHEPGPARRRSDGRSEVGADRSSELARIPIVRVRREREPGKRVPTLARLLSSF